MKKEAISTIFDWGPVTLSDLEDIVTRARFNNFPMDTAVIVTLNGNNAVGRIEVCRTIEEEEEEEDK